MAIGAALAPEFNKDIQDAIDKRLAEKYADFNVESRIPSQDFATKVATDNIINVKLAEIPPTHTTVTVNFILPNGDVEMYLIRNVAINSFLAPAHNSDIKDAIDQQLVAKYADYTVEDITHSQWLVLKDADKNIIDVKLAAIEDGDTDEGDTGEGDTDEGGTDEGGTDEGGTDEGGTDEGGTDEGGTDEGGTDEGGTGDGGTGDGGNTDNGVITPGRENRPQNNNGVTAQPSTNEPTIETVELSDAPVPLSSAPAPAEAPEIEIEDLETPLGSFETPAPEEVEITDMATPLSDAPSIPGNGSPATNDSSTMALFAMISALALAASGFFGRKAFKK